MVQCEDGRPGYRAHDAESLRAYAAGLPSLRERLGGGPADWRIEEVGDGNLNLVFKLQGPAGGLAVKQALPYVRLVGESWPLPLSRAHYERQALAVEGRLAPGLVPEVLHYDETLALIAMELLEPHIIMRQGMIAGQVYPGFVEAISDFAARCYFLTSDLALPAAEKKALVGAFAGNSALCKITEDLVFTEPYMAAEKNRWTAPYLDPLVAALRGDAALKLAAMRLKLAFLSEGQALLHGDLHTGSIMLTGEDLRVIDPEFAFVGPIGFDLGALLANLLMSYFSQAGHEEAPGARAAYGGWILEAVAGVWTRFKAKFLALWRGPEAAGDAFTPALFEGAAGGAALEGERRAYMRRLYRETLAFAGAEIVRRTLGLAHNIDFERIEEPARRARCEARAILLARRLMVTPEAFPGIADLVAAAERANGQTPVVGGEGI